jgi:threonine dehydrogenase-like Zn-dependent dehydrogenase
MARVQGTEVIDFNQDDSVECIRELYGGIGVDRVIDAVGVDAVSPSQGPAAAQARERSQQFKQEVQSVAPQTDPQGDQWRPGDAPSQVLEWAVQAVAKAGTMSIIGVCPPQLRSFPIGMAMNRNLTLRMGNCNHRHYIPSLVEDVHNGTNSPEDVLTRTEPLTDVLEGYRAFDRREPGWMKVQLIRAA